MYNLILSFGWLIVYDDVVGIRWKWRTLDSVSVNALVYHYSLSQSSNALRTSTDPNIPKKYQIWSEFVSEWKLSKLKITGAAKFRITIINVTHLDRIV